MTTIKSFGDFMFEVLSRADRISLEQSGRPLAYKYNAPSTIIKMIGVVLNTGWGTFSTLSKIVSNASYFAFSAALAAFLVSPSGLVVTGALVYWGGAESIRLLYHNRSMVEAVKRIGDKYESRFCKCLAEDKCNELIAEAADELRNTDPA